MIYMNGKTISPLAVLKSDSSVKVYNRIDDMKNDNSILSGDYCITLGYYEANDGGGAEYYIKVKDNAEDTYINATLNNGLIAMQLLKGKTLNVKTIGVRYNSNTYKVANSAIIENFLVKHNAEYDLFFPKGRVWISNIHFLSAPPNGDDYTPNISIIGEGGVHKGGNEAYSYILTDGEDLFYDKRPLGKGITIVAKDIRMVSTESFIVSGIVSGKCFGAEYARENNAEVNFHYNNVFVGGFEYGIYSPQWSCGGSGGTDIEFAGCKYGIYIESASHLLNLTNINCNYCANGINLGFGGDGNLIRNMHVASGYYGSDRDGIENFVALYSRGGITLDGLYCEPYASDAQSEKQILIDFEPYDQSNGGKPLVLRNVTPCYPGWGYSGKFMRIGCYLGNSPGRPFGDTTFTFVVPIDSQRLYMGIIDWRDSRFITINDFKNLITFRNKESGKLLYLGNSFKGDCIPEIYDVDYILNQNNSLYINTTPVTNVFDSNDSYPLWYNNLTQYCPNHETNKDLLSQTIANIISSPLSTIKLKMNGYIEIGDLPSNSGQTEFDISIESGTYKHYVGHFKNVVGGKKQVFNFNIELPHHQIKSYGITGELLIVFRFDDNNKKYIPLSDASKIFVHYTHSIEIN